MQFPRSFLVGNILCLSALLGAGCATSTSSPRSVAQNQPNCARFDKGAAAVDNIGLNNAVVVKRVQGERVYAAKHAMRYTSGAELFVPAEGHVSRQWLQRVLECRAAESAHAQASLDAKDPFAVPGVQAKVMEGTNGHFVRLTTEDRDAARELVERAELAYGPASRAR